MRGAYIGRVHASSTNGPISENVTGCFAALGSQCTHLQRVSLPVAQVLDADMVSLAAAGTQRAGLAHRIGPYVTCRICSRFLLTAFPSDLALRQWSTLARRHTPTSTAHLSRRLTLQSICVRLFATSLSPPHGSLFFWLMSLQARWSHWTCRTPVGFHPQHSWPSHARHQASQRCIFPSGVAPLTTIG